MYLHTACVRVFVFFVFIVYFVCILVISTSALDCLLQNDMF